ncbi:replication factor A protein 3 [Histomonas meleagridis]|uniref:replication factor A protein 3 n=1 Tax=Histomonas meleagridis TaxID=135588 RepID=UPI003559A9DB|nr:replication factor A protein 3 [Histomonas meleagridis]KAH0805653.1 replication factor A protein 3 [Histomonas meleagridis]
MATPRVNGQTYRKYEGEVVRIVGAVVDGNGSPKKIRTTDGQIVLIHPNGSSNGFTAEYVEVTGRVQADGAIVEVMSVPITSTIDNDAWNQMVQLMEQHKEIFQ